MILTFTARSTFDALDRATTCLEELYPTASITRVDFDKATKKATIHVDVGGHTDDGTLKNLCMRKLEKASLHNVAISDLSRLQE